MQRENTPAQPEATQGRSVPPLARLAALLANSGSRSDDLPAASLLNAQQQKQLQHELQQLLMRHLGAAQRQGRAVVPPKDAAAEALEREETLAELQSACQCLAVHVASLTAPVHHRR